MKLMATLALSAALGVSVAYAQETTPPAVPGSSCAAIVQAPAPPDGATVSGEQMRAAVLTFEAWRLQEQTTLDCRRAEADALNAQATARANEYRAAQADNTARAAVFQAQIDIFQARPLRDRR